MEDQKEVAELRARIDELDDEILGLVARRVQAALRIAELKRKLGLPIYDPERERDIFTRLCAQAPEPLKPNMVRRIFERLIDETRWAEQRGPSE